MTSKLGLHWIREHPDNQRDLAHVEAMQYPSIKLFKSAWDNPGFSRDLLTVLPNDSLILARDHDLSEQKQDMWNDPVGTGTRHANEWAEKVQQRIYTLPLDRTFFLGINEPDATDGDRHAIDRYTTAFLDRLRAHNLRGGAFSFSTGHPRTVDGTPHTPANYTVFEGSHQAIVRGGHIGVLHIYGTAAVPSAPGNFDRLKACDWTDVQWIVGECGIDEHVIGGGPHEGYLIPLKDDPTSYCEWLDRFIMGVNDPRIHSYQVFTYDFSHPWWSFDVSAIHDALERYPWQHIKAAAKPPHTIHLPKLGTGAAVAYVTAPAGLNLRSAPDGDILTAIPYAEQVHIVGVEQGGWLRVRYGNTEGYAAAVYISLQEPDALPEPVPTPEPMPQPGNDWPRIYAFIKRWEGGFVNHPSDPGGATNKGITLATYTRWRQAHGQPQPTVADLRAITDAEVERIFYEWYYLASGADKLPWPLNLAQADTAVNAGVGRAQEMLQKSGGDFLTYMGHLITWYTSIPNFEVFGRAWIKRRAELLLEAAK